MTTGFPAGLRTDRLIGAIGGRVQHCVARDSDAAEAMSGRQKSKQALDYVVNYTNAPSTWQYAGMRVRGAVQDEETALVDRRAATPA